MILITKELVEEELVPLLKTINEQVTVEDIYGADYYYTDGFARGAICKIMIQSLRVYLWSNGKISYRMEPWAQEYMDEIESWISSKIRSSD